MKIGKLNELMCNVEKDKDEMKEIDRQKDTKRHWDEYWEIAGKDPEWLKKNHIPSPSFWEQFKVDWIWYICIAWIIFKIFCIIRYWPGH